MRDPLATTYNDASVLENFHISEAFKVLYDERTNILDGLSVDEMRLFRQFIIKVPFVAVSCVRYSGGLVFLDHPPTRRVGMPILPLLFGRILCAHSLWKASRTGTKISGRGALGGTAVSVAVRPVGYITLPRKT